MAIYHMNVRGIAPARGSSAVKSAAYQSGECLTRDVTGETVAYERAERVLACGLELPVDAPEWAHSRERLWNEAELAHGGGTALVARRIEVALPRELDHDEQRACVLDYVRPLVESGHGVDWAIHDDGKGNPHAHILVTEQTIGHEGFERQQAQKSVKAYLVRDDQGAERQIVSGEWRQAKADGWEKVYTYRHEGEQVRLTKTQAKALGLGNADRVSANPVSVNLNLDGAKSYEQARSELVKERARWATVANKHLAEHAERTQTAAQTIDHRSYADRGIDRLPTIHEGRSNSANLEERREKNALIRTINRALEQAQARLRQLVEQVRQHAQNALRWFDRRDDSVTRKRVLEISRQKDLSLNAAVGELGRHGAALKRELAAGVEIAFAAPSENHFERLAEVLKERGVSMRATADGNGLVLSSPKYGGVEFNLDAIGVDVESLVGLSKRANAEDLLRKYRAISMEPDHGPEPETVAELVPEPKRRISRGIGLSR